MRYFTILPGFSALIALSRLVAKVTVFSSTCNLFTFVIVCDSVRSVMSGRDKAASPGSVIVAPSGSVEAVRPYTSQVTYIQILLDNFSRRIL